MQTKKSFHGLILVIGLILGFSLRMWAASTGHNYDVESYEIVSNLVLIGKNVYANTERYNYGPIWFIILGIIKSIQLHLGFNDIRTFHLLIASFLSCVDVVTALILAQWFSLTVALIFFLNPISILITGYHSQFDNLAVLIGIFSWYFISETERRENFSLFLLSAVLMGLSLVTKHILIFFPLWILVFPSLATWRKRLLYCLIAYGIFLGGFLPFSFTPEALSGILKNVFGYSSNPTGVLLIRLVDLFLPINTIIDYRIDLMLGKITISNDMLMLLRLSRILLMSIWVSLMIGTGWLMNRKYPHLSFWLYLVALITWTTAMADQYLAIPLTTCAIFYKKLSAKLYFLVTTLYLLSSPYNIASSLDLSLFRPFVSWTYYHSQIWLLLLLVTLYLNTGLRSSHKFFSDS